MARILRVIAGLASGSPAVTPVVNAKAGKNGPVPRVSGNPVDLFAEWLKKKKLTTINPEHGREFQTAIGRAPNGYSSLFRQAIDVGLLKKIPHKNRLKITYKVMK